MGRVNAQRYVVNAGWDDVPHLSFETKRDLLASTPPFLRDARSKGIPSLGEGAVYPIPLEEVTCRPFAIPDYWRRAYGFDVGWNRTAAIWLAQDPTDMVLYAYTEYYRGQVLPAIHAEAIKARGAWIPGAIDPASRGRSQDEGKKLFTQYQTKGLNITPAINAVEPGIYEVWSLLETRRLILFDTLANTKAEYLIYRREDGKIVKQNDHLMDALRYAVMSFDAIARVQPPKENRARPTDPGDTRVNY